MQKRKGFNVHWMYNRMIGTKYVGDAFSRVFVRHEHALVRPIGPKHEVFVDSNSKRMSDGMGLF